VSDPKKARRSDYVLRAMAASEIAESAPTPALQRQFLSLAALWLWEAQDERPGLCGKASPLGELKA
jgi:hypothetical protein